MQKMYLNRYYNNLVYDSFIKYGTFKGTNHCFAIMPFNNRVYICNQSSTSNNPSIMKESEWAVFKNIENFQKNYYTVEFNDMSYKDFISKFKEAKPAKNWLNSDNNQKLG